MLDFSELRWRGSGEASPSTSTASIPCLQWAIHNYCHFNSVEKSFKRLQGLHVLLNRGGICVNANHRCTWRHEHTPFWRSLESWSQFPLNVAALDPADCGQWSPLSLKLLNFPERKKSPHKCPCTPPQWLCLFQSLSFYFYFSPTLMANGPPFVPSSSIICAAGYPRHKISHLTHGWTIWLLHLATNGDLQTAETAGWRTWGMSQMEKIHVDKCTSPCAFTEWRMMVEFIF